MPNKTMKHKPVMLAEVLQQLDIKKNGIYLDCTFGRGGHSSAILNQLDPSGRLLAIDRDPDAVRSVVAQKMAEDNRFTLFHSSFSELKQITTQAGLTGQVNGILLDLGVSSPQLDNPERGFSFLHDGLLDMRMDSTSGITAAQWLACVDEKDLAKVLFEFGEERFARRIANAIVMTRTKTPINTTKQLVELISDTVPVMDKFKHPATRSFQAIRIAINNELEQLKTVLMQSLDILKPGGRLVVISFHSLEDRIVKRFIRDESGGKYDPGKLPIRQVDIKKGLLKKIGKPIKAETTEISENPRSRSAIMRIAERI